MQTDIHLHRSPFPVSFFGAVVWKLHTQGPRFRQQRQDKAGNREVGDFSTNHPIWCSWLLPVTGVRRRRRCVGCDPVYTWSALAAICWLLPLSGQYTKGCTHMRYVSGDRDNVTHKTKKDGGGFWSNLPIWCYGFFFLCLVPGSAADA